jgi:hypothetical protein
MCSAFLLCYNVVRVFSFQEAKMDKTVIEVLNGYARANAYLEDERRQRLANLTPEQARLVFGALVEAWQRQPHNAADRQRLDSWRLETLIAVRRAFKQLAEAKGYI